VNISIATNYDELSIQVANFIADVVTKRPNAFICLPSGESPTGTLKYLVKYGHEGKVDFSSCRFVALDEWQGIGPRTEGSTSYYLHSNFFSPLGIQDGHIFLFDGLAKDLDRECKRMDEIMAKNGPLDIMLVGIGMNGHIGLNEPGTSFDLHAHHRPLDEITKTVAQKYFKESTPLTEGITLGLKYLTEARFPVLIANGAKKADIIQKALEGPITNQVPASLLQELENSYIFLDVAAAGSLTRRSR